MTNDRYNYKKCKSLFGYAANTYIRSKGQCQLCGCGGAPINFDLWRQMTVEHLIGKSQGGYLKQIREVVIKRFPDLPSNEQELISNKIDAMNTVTACSFCNSTTSRDVNSKTMEQLVFEVNGGQEIILNYVESELLAVLKRKRETVKWKLKSVKEAFELEISSKINE